MALSKIDVANMVENQMPQANLADNINFRNIIINGDMSIAQRGTSVSSISSGNTLHTCDRWKTYASSAGTWTQTQEALTSGDPYTNGFATSLKLDCTTANGSLSSGSYLQIAQSIEAQNLQYIKKGTSNAEQLTASFWVKSTKTGTNILQFVSLDNTVRICAKSYTINSSDTWEKKTITIPADTSSTGKIDNNNGEGMRMIFWVAAGTDYTSGTLATTWADTANANRAVGQINNADSTSNNFEITGVQLEAGTSASDFEFLPFDVTLARCHRYCYVMGASQNAENLGQFTVGSGLCRSSGSAIFTDIVGSYPQPLRTEPSLTQVGGDLDDIFCYKNNGTSASPTSISVARNTIALKVTNNMGLSSGLTAGDATIQQIQESDTDLVFDAEL